MSECGVRACVCVCVCVCVCMCMYMYIHIIMCITHDIVTELTMMEAWE